MPAGCSYLKSTKGSAIVCEGTGGGADGGVTSTACATGEVQVCSSDADCPSGMSCQPGKWKIYQIGFCQ
jgi:Cys-rich repeat protein